MRRLYYCNGIQTKGRELFIWQRRSVHRQGNRCTQNENFNWQKQSGGEEESLTRNLQLATASVQRQWSILYFSFSKNVYGITQYVGIYAVARERAG